MTTRTSEGLAAASGITLALAGLALAWDASGLDLALARLAGGAGGFPWRDSWLLAVAFHEGGRLLAWALALALCLAVWWPLGPLAGIGQRERLQLALSCLFGALAVAVLKSGSLTSCPWDLAEFGGFARYVSHWYPATDGGSGHCFPAGHAASGFTFVGGFFAFRVSHPALARRWLAGALCAGLLLGLVQQWRGAHFMSHTLWSAFVCWAVACLLQVAWPRTWNVEGA